MDRLGTPFYSMKEKGTGLGLTVTYSIVKSMNGRVQVESKKGVGTTFVIWLPVYKPEKEEEIG
ncbi:MAG: ATP-binding protein [Bacillaceae bacterium]|nr:ATP-binding protein [Bacillaceae bacterium]